MRMVHLQTGKIIPVPMHGSKDVSIGLVREIIREAGVTVEEWLAL
jgi:predicted RNA binding protein YcfA (HicA-like mRNA interferase family)